MNNLREQIVAALLVEGAGPGSSIHSWRCEYPDRYGDCDCVGETADAVLAVVGPEMDALREDRDAWEETNGINEGTIQVLIARTEAAEAALAEAWDQGYSAGWSDGGDANCAGLEVGHVNPYQAGGVN